jgi:hypothetical protein
MHMHKRAHVHAHIHTNTDRHTHFCPYGITNSLKVSKIKVSDMKGRPCKNEGSRPYFKQHVSNL